MSARRICVFCGSQNGNDAAFADAAMQLGEVLVRRGYGLVFGGGHVGLMGRLADAVLGAGGEAIGVIPEGLVQREVAHLGLSELRVVHTMHERKALMAELSSGFLALPGGLGTLEELFEAVTWSQLGIHSKPCGILDVDGYYAKLLAFLDTTIERGFVSEANRALLLTSADPEELLDRMESWRSPISRRWLSRAEI